ncbi:MAG TPA: hypothetical protein VIF62_13425 [Labilithrix sp.]
MKMKYPKKLLTLQNLQGGQFGTIDVTAMSDQFIELDFAADFDRLTPESARALIGALDRWLSQLPGAAVVEETVVVIKG